MTTTAPPPMHTQGPSTVRSGTNRFTRRGAPMPTGVVRGPGRTRRMPWVALGSLLIAGAIVGFALFTISQASRTLVWVAAADIPAGATIERSQLSLVAIGADPGVRLLARGQEAAVIGAVARSPIPAGTPLSAAMVVGPHEVVPLGQAVVGAELKRGQYPSGRLATGDRVALVATSVGNRTAEDAVSLGTGRIWAIEQPSRSAPDSLFVSLLVPADRATVVANVASQDHLRLVMVNAAAPEVGPQNLPTPTDSPAATTVAAPDTVGPGGGAADKPTVTAAPTASSLPPATLAPTTRAPATTARPPASTAPTSSGGG